MIKQMPSSQTANHLEHKACMRIKHIFLKLIRHDLFVPLLIGIILRLVLMPFFIWPHDIVAQYYSIFYVLNHHDPYSVFVSMYPPLIYVIFCPLLSLISQMGIELRFDVFPETFEAAGVTELITSIYGDPIFLVFWKIPLFVFDLLLGILIYQFTKKLTLNSSKAKKSFILWFFNPFVLITSYMHGAFDVIVAFFILLGLYFLIEKKYFFSGISFGLGGLTKLSPFLVAIPILGMIFMKHAKSSLKEAFLITFKFLAGCIIPALICLPWCINYYNMVNTVTLNEVSIKGGLNQWFFAANRNLRYSINSNIHILMKVFYLYPLLSLIPVLLYHKIFKKPHDFPYITLLFSILSFEILYFVLPLTVQPQYLMWIIPTLIVIYAKKKSFLYPFTIFSLAASAFFFSIQSPYAFMYPLALFTSLCAVEQLNMSIVNYASRPGFFSLYLREDLCTIFGAFAFLGHLITLYLVIKELSKIGKDGKP